MALDPNRWAGNVEKAMLELAHGGGALDASRYGQALQYVRAIQSLYGSYRNVPALADVPRGAEHSS